MMVFPIMAGVGDSPSGTITGSEVVEDVISESLIRDHMDRFHEKQNKKKS